MAKRENFTAERVAGFRCKPGRQQSIFWDGKAPGLGLRVTAAGAKAFIFETRLHGKTLRLTIGDLRTWAIGQAQAEATRLKALTDQGIDPRQVRAEQAAKAEAERAEARRHNIVVADAWADYLTARRPKWGERHYRNHLNMAKPGGEPRKRGRRKGEPETTMPGPLVPVLSLKLAALDAEAVKAWLEPLAARTPTQAAQTYRALRAFVAWCADNPDYAGSTHADACNRRMARDTLPKPKAKDDCLQREQLAPWFAAVRQLGNPVIAAYLQGLLLTGARREELAGLTWGDVDFQWRSLTIRDKVEGERIIPLPPYLASLLASLPRRSDWVFSSPTAASGRIQEPRIAHLRALKAAGLPHLSLHGLRRSFGTLAEWVEAPTGVVAQIMGHKPSALAEKHYRRRPLDLLRMWHTRIEIWMLEQAGIQFDAGQQQGLRVLKGGQQ